LCWIRLDYIVLYETPKSKQTLEAQQLLDSLAKALKKLHSQESEETGTELSSSELADQTLQMLPTFTQELKKNTLAVEVNWKNFSAEERAKYKHFLDQTKNLESMGNELNRQKLRLHQLYSNDSHDVVDDFFRVLRQFRKTVSQALDEAELLQEINQAIPTDIQKYYDELIAKRQDEMLTPEEYKDLLRLTEQVEKLEAQRIKNLVNLAHLRKVSLTELMEYLGIQTPEYA